MNAFEYTRRQLIHGSGLAVLTVGAGALAGCGTTASTTSAGTPTATPSTSGGTTGPATTPATTAGSASPPAGVAVKKADVPVGGGKVLPDDNMVVTQPTAGQFRAFSDICTHQQCPVSAVRDGAIQCDCHGSKFSLTTGEPESGPAQRALDTKNVTEQGDTIYVS